MNGLLNVASVVNGDGNWAAGYEAEALGCGLSVSVTDVCTPARAVVTGAAIAEAYPSAYEVAPFAIVSRTKRPTRCSSGEEQKQVDEALSAATEMAVGQVFWSGIAGWTTGAFLESTDVATVATGTTTLDTVGTALAEFYTLGGWEVPILHLGIKSALDVAELFESPLFEGLSVAVSPGYPSAGVAVTGPITVHLGPVQSMQSYDSTVNRSEIEANRLAAIEFDPCIAVLAAATP